jgi:WS/DGAT/MGAT family acyltransferase
MAGMAHLTKLDTAHLQVHDPDQHASLAVAAVAIVDGAVPDPDGLKSLLAERIQSMPRCTQLLRTHPSDSSREWIDHPGFDVTQHLHRVVVTRPGDDADLFRAVAHSLERPLNLDLPLWECWVIEGLKDNQWAILMKIHHCLADGSSAAHILTRLCDDADTDAFANHVGTNQSSRSSSEEPGLGDVLWRTAGALTSAFTGTIWPAARTPSIDPVPTLRRYSTVRVPIDAVDTVCRKFGVSTNDVALTAITEGFRNVLLKRGEQPRADSLRTVVRPDNRISALLPYLPVEHDDPVQRLRAVHDRLQSKQSDRGQPNILESALNCLPITLRSQVIQLLSRLPHSGIVTLATNVPGPRHHLRLMGRRLERLLPIPPTAMALSTGVAVLSYSDELVFGITADYEAVPDIRQLVAGIETGMARLVALSQDSVLLFSKDRRRRSSRALPNRVGPPATERARR